ncbi:hypothetical protein QBC35DRAFT_504495 [Podospora australis]|uniref:Uncharacterized protein n=1 Tax=Podospora australis TaxID=1536484 RepID=A0AAN6WNJ9_9PEZI|nr:hypothetical protein QBC35DRAFT_504495 [Podospora australis]
MGPPPLPVSGRCRPGSRPRSSLSVGSPAVGSSPAPVVDSSPAPAADSSEVAAPSGQGGAADDQSVPAPASGPAPRSRKRKAPAPKLDEDGNPIKRKRRSAAEIRAEKEALAAAADADAAAAQERDMVPDDAVATGTTSGPNLPEPVPTRPTASRNTRRTSAQRSSLATADSEAENDDSDTANLRSSLRRSLPKLAQKRSHLSGHESGSNGGRSTRSARSTAGPDAIFVSDRGEERRREELANTEGMKFMVGGAFGGGKWHDTTTGVVWRPKNPMAQSRKRIVIKQKLPDPVQEPTGREDDADDNGSQHSDHPENDDDAEGDQEEPVFEPRGFRSRPSNPAESTAPAPRLWTRLSRAQLEARDREAQSQNPQQVQQRRQDWPVQGLDMTLTEASERLRTLSVASGNRALRTQDDFLSEYMFAQYLRELNPSMIATLNTLAELENQSRAAPSTDSGPGPQSTSHVPRASTGAVSRSQSALRPPAPPARYSPRYDGASGRSPRPGTLPGQTQPMTRSITGAKQPGTYVPFGEEDENEEMGN